MRSLHAVLPDSITKPICDNDQFARHLHPESAMAPVFCALILTKQSDFNASKIETYIQHYDNKPIYQPGIRLAKTQMTNQYPLAFELQQGGKDDCPQELT
jgi:hypothetical protein